MLTHVFAVHVLDTDGNGSVSVDEFTAALSSGDFDGLFMTVQIPGWCGVE